MTIWKAMPALRAPVARARFSAQILYVNIGASSPADPFSVVQVWNRETPPITNSAGSLKQDDANREPGSELRLPKSLFLGPREYASRAVDSS
jgi:hypothetical protein